MILLETARIKYIRHWPTPLFWDLRTSGAHEIAATFIVELLEDLALQFLDTRPLCISNHISAEFNATCVASAFVAERLVKIFKYISLDISIIYTVIDLKLLHQAEDPRDNIA
jgi:hypothetical protein